MIDSNPLGPKTLVIDDEQVTFKISLAESAGARSEGQALPIPVPYLGAETSTWSAVLTEDVQYLRPIQEQLSDNELERLYRTARGW